MTYSTHIVDMTNSRPAVGVRVHLDQQEDDRWRILAHGVSDADGRVTPGDHRDWQVDRGVYRFTYDTNAYFAELGQLSSYPEIVVKLIISDPSQSWDLAVLITPHAFTVCRKAVLSHVLRRQFGM